MNYNFFLVADVIDCLAHDRQNHLRHLEEMFRQNFFNRHHHDFGNIILRFNKIFRRQFFCVTKSLLSFLIRLLDNFGEFVLNFFFAVFNAFLFAVFVARVVAFLLNFFQEFFSLLLGVLDDFFSFGLCFVNNFLRLLFRLNFNFFGLTFDFLRLSFNFFGLLFELSRLSFFLVCLAQSFFR